MTGLFVPALLISALPVTEGGFIRETGGQIMMLFDKWLTSPSVYLYMLFGLASELFLSALFLADYSREANDTEAYAMYREQARPGLAGGHRSGGFDARFFGTGSGMVVA